MNKRKISPSDFSHDRETSVGDLADWFCNARSSNYGSEGNHTGYEDKSVNNITWSIYSINY